MVGSQSKQLHELLQAFTSTSAVDVFQPMAEKLELQPSEAKSALLNEISTKYPYIEQTSTQLIDLLMPQLQGFMLAACQQALEKGHQAAMVQQQSDEDEQLSKALAQLATLTKKHSVQSKELAASEQLNIKQTEQLSILQKTKALQEDSNSELEAELSQLKEVFEKSSEENSMIKKQLDESKVETEKFQHLIEQTDHALTKQKEHNALQSTKLKELITQRSEENSSLDEKFEQQSQDVTLLKDENKVLVSEDKQKTKALADKTQEITTLNKTIEKLDSTAKEKDLVIERLQKLGDSLTSKELEFEQENQKLAEALNDVKKALSGSNDELSNITQTNASINESNHKYKKENNRLLEEMNALEQNLSVTKKEFSTLEQGSKDTLESLEQNAKEQIKTLEAQSQTEKEALEQASKDKIAELELQHQVKLDKLEQHSKAIKDNADASSTKTEGRFNDLKKDLREETKRLEASLLEAQSNIESLEQDKQDFIEQVDKFKELELEYKDEILTSRSKLEAQDNELNFAKGRNSSMQSRQETEIHQARTAYESLRSENLEHVQVIEDLEAKVMEFKLKFEYAQKQLVS
jgi:chromosome segregation ATPase